MAVVTGPLWRAAQGPTGERLSVLSAGRHTQSLGPQRPAYLGSLSASILIPVFHSSPRLPTWIPDWVNQG